MSFGKSLSMNGLGRKLDQGNISRLKFQFRYHFAKAMCSRCTIITSDLYVCSIIKFYSLFYSQYVPTCLHRHILLKHGILFYVVEGVKMTFVLYSALDILCYNRSFFERNISLQI